MSKRKHLGSFTLICAIGAIFLLVQAVTVYPETTGNTHQLYLPIVAKPLESWSRIYGTESDDEAATVFIDAGDGGYFLISLNEYEYPMLMKLGNDGTIVWQKHIDLVDMGNRVHGKVTQDGGLIITFMGFSDGSEGRAAYLLKLDRDGNLEWRKGFGGPYRDTPTYVEQTNDGGFIFVGDISLNGVSVDTWVVRVDKNGDLLWEHIYHYYSLYNYGYAITQTTDEGFIITGSGGLYIEPVEGELSVFNNDLFLLKIDKDGVVQWQKVLDGGQKEYGRSIVQTNAGDYIVAGYTVAFSGENRDVWVLRVDQLGNVIWQKTYGGSEDDSAYSLIEGVDGNFVVAGSTESFGAGKLDAWIFELDGLGNIIWQKTYGGAEEDEATSIQRSGDKYLIAGATASFGPVSSNPWATPDNDAWALKINSDGSMTNCNLIGESSAIITNTIVTPRSEYVSRIHTTETGTSMPTISLMNGIWTEWEICPTVPEIP